MLIDVGCVEDGGSDRNGNRREQRNELSGKSQLHLVGMCSKDVDVNEGGIRCEKAVERVIKDGAGGEGVVVVVVRRLGMGCGGGVRESFGGERRGSWSDSLVSDNLPWLGTLD